MESPAMTLKQPLNTVTAPNERFHPIANIFPLLEGEEFDALVHDVQSNGLYEPIIEFESLILDGRNRYRACLQAGMEPRFAQFDGGDPVAFVLSKNIYRRHLNESQRAMIMARIARLGRGGDHSNPPRGVLQADAAKALHIGVRTGQRAKRVLEHGVPELLRRVEAGEIPVKVAADVATFASDVQDKLVAEPAKLRGALKAIARAERERRLAARTVEAALALGRTCYSVIYADPPWRFEPYSRDTGLDRAADNHYPTLETEAICAIKPPAARDCVLFLWTTAPMLCDAMRVVDAWGFRYRSNLVWGKSHTGTGYWNRNKHEHLLIALKGEVPAPAAGQQPESLILADARRHSEKPEIFAHLIETMFPHCRRLEMFAREPRPGWDVWGNELPANEPAQ